MSRAPKELPALGFVASNASKCHELDVTADHCARTGQLLVVGSTNALRHSRSLRDRIPNLRIRIDPFAWAGTTASPDQPLVDRGDLFDLDEWCMAQFPIESGLEAYTPSLFLRADDRESRRELLARTAGLPANVMTFLPIDADVLRAHNRDDFFADLEPAAGRRLAFAFAHKNDPLAHRDRLDGLRRLLHFYPGSSIDYVDPLVATDALAHGAGWVGVGASSSRRMPSRPFDPSGGGPLSDGYLPGLFLSELLELRNPNTYADWFANTAPPICATCRRRLDVFETTADDKACIVKHNLHATTETVEAMLAADPAERPSRLNDVRLAAHRRHLELRSPTGEIMLNLTLRRLLELDDPRGRSMAPGGTWR